MGRTIFFRDAARPRRGALGAFAAAALAAAALFADAPAAQAEDAAPASGAVAGASDALRTKIKILARGGGMEKIIVHEGGVLPPEGAFTTPEGDSVTLGALTKGKVTFVNLWATWCPPCLKELPSIKSLADQRGGEDFQVVVINIDSLPEERVRQLMDLRPIPGGAGKLSELFALDGRTEGLAFHRDRPNILPRQMAVIAMPTSFIYNRDGVEIARLLGDAEWDSAEALAVIDAVIADGGGS